MKPPTWRFLLVAGGLVLTGVSPAGAHGFGQRYDLPVPLSLYLSGAAAAVAFSFVLLALFLRGAPGARAYPRVNLLRWPLGRLLAHPALLASAKAASVALFFLLVLAGLAGDQHPLRNLVPTLVWVIWWVGLSYVSALAGDLWALVNPWRAVFGWAEALYRRATSGGELSRRLPYPEALGVWPGFLLFFAFAWVELIFPGRAVPAALAGLAIGYSVVTWTGMFLFGRERWLRRGEAFWLAFGVLARFAPTEIRVTRRAVCDACSVDCRSAAECVNCAECFSRADPADREWNLRPPAVGLLRVEPTSVSMMGFIVLMLSTVTFDGFMATPAWASLEGVLSALLRGPEGLRLTVVETMGLAAFPVLFLGVFLLVTRLMAAVSGAGRWWRALAPGFAFTLVPIAIAYHLAHYLSFLVIQGQLIVPLASDPFGFGWDLLGTAGYRINIAAVGARFAWFTAVVAIVAGHIIAVYLAHVLAVRTLGERAQALRSQYPITALMVGYTMVSLWILAQPIVESGMRLPTTEETAGLVRVPSDAVLPEPVTGLLWPVGEGKTARVRLTYRLLASKFHDGTRLTVADLLFPYAFAYRWGARAPGGPPADPSIVEATALIRERLAGVRVVGVERTAKGFGELTLVQEMPVVEVYLTSAAGGLEDKASVAPPWSTLPWHVIALMEETVTRGWAAFSREEAARRGVEWLDLARVPSLRDRMASLVREFEASGYVPEPLKRLASADEGRQRWAALRAFYDKRGHFLVTAGPYILEKWSEDSVVLGVFRDLSYPLGVGSFDAYPIPRRAYISRLEPRDGGVTISAEVERLDKFQRSYALLREPFRPGGSLGFRPDIVVGRYLVLSPAGRVAKSGTVTPAKDGAFRVDLRGLQPGRYVLQVALYLNDNTVNPDIRRIEYVVPAGSTR